MKRRRRVTRWLIAGALLLIGGAIVNVAVAWGLAYFLFIPSSSHSHFAAEQDGPGYGRWIVNVYQFKGQVRVSSGWRAVDSIWRPARPEGNPRELIPSWATFLLPESHTDEPVHLIVADARGWPMIALYSACAVDVAIGMRPGPRQGMRMSDGEVHYGEQKEMIAGIRLPSRKDPRIVPSLYLRAIPTVPLWTGFAINTLFYAAILWMLFAVPFALRRKRRRKRGLCQACAYPIGTSPVCTECGRAVTPRSSEIV